jgi:hypothetical protein
VVGSITEAFFLVVAVVDQEEQTDRQDLLTVIQELAVAVVTAALVTILQETVLSVSFGLEQHDHFRLQILEIYRSFR